jgi:hypothetical protein
MNKLDRQIREALIARYGEAQPPNSLWRHIIRLVADLDRVAYPSERREEPILVI